ncbi:MAG: ASKHA domain-containing protein [Coriobacteriales bacterium]|jgi:uncharacterized 2Fe-2S/4Fe-4S cluster protein (DUF4445 family)|nr:ASKHA domain-containing protein [Coriobacteriales bacterium]
MPEEAPIHIRLPELNRVLEARRGDKLLNVMRAAGINLSTDCGGLGRCGTCRVLVDGAPHRACTFHVTSNIEVRTVRPPSNDDYAILLDHRPSTTKNDGKGKSTNGDKTGPSCNNTVPPPHAIAIDLGTTTVVGKLINLTTGHEQASYARLNGQALYGTDVISRIEHSQDDARLLSKLITAQIDNAIAAMLSEAKVASEQVQKLVIAGNTTMSYLLLGWPCRSLGTAPFTPAYRIEPPYPYRAIFGTDTLSCDCDVLPFISAYVGGDLVAGLAALRDEDDFILIDMGTNGELIFKRGDTLLCTATAAGPAFEGGGIECGLGSTHGAISSVRYENDMFQLETIGAAPPIGICGSGILDLMAILVREGFVDTTGFLARPTRDQRIILVEAPKGTDARTIFFTQKDVRQYQLAKSAIRAGLEILLQEMGGEAPRKVFLAGGFGQNLNPESAIATGLLPEAFRGRVFPLGNSSLGGAVAICLDESARADAVACVAHGQVINLATHPVFNDIFIKHLAL